jgi:hypothetical protein
VCDRVTRFQNAPFCPISAAPIIGNLQQAQILILEIRHGIPAVKIFAFLDLGPMAKLNILKPDLNKLGKIEYTF